MLLLHQWTEKVAAGRASHPALLFFKQALSCVSYTAVKKKMAKRMVGFPGRPLVTEAARFCRFAH